MCKYEDSYFDHDSGAVVPFRCEEADEKDGFCIFHHPEIWKEKPRQIRRKFLEKVRLNMQGKEKLLCIGYNLREVTLKEVVQNPAYFNNSIFHGKIHLSGATFSQGVYFLGATFSEGVYFTEAKFTKGANFSGATFREEARFTRATFTEPAYFRRAMFAQEVDFGRAKFNKGASFIHATFTKRADFSGATFNQKAIFVATTFNEEAAFTNATFTKMARFRSLRAVKNALVDHSPILVFENVTLDDPKHVHFDRFDLSNTSFVATDVSQISIGEKATWHLNKKLLDERRAEKGDFTHEKAATVCRRFRQNLECRLRYNEAGHFFVREMDIKRRNVKTKSRALRWLRTNVFSALAWYRYFSNYGESYQRIIPWIIFTPLTAAFLTTVLTTPISCPTQLASNLQNYIKNYLYAFFQLKSDNYAELSVRILSLLLMGQLYIALRRQFERRYPETQTT
jgi:uncharacterized protein YjbI with pentapeptide repeats